MAMRARPTVDLSSHAGPWTEEDYLALPESSSVELVDGSLLVSPHGGTKHQRLAGALTRALADAAPDSLEVLAEVNVRLRPGRILIPDIAVINRPGAEDPILSADDIALVCEITSPTHAATDHILKLNLYAQAGITHYLIVDLDSAGPRGIAYRLDLDAAYRIVTQTEPGEVLRLTEPFRVALDLAVLARATRPRR